MSEVDASIREQLSQCVALLGESVCIVLADGSEKVVFASDQTARLYDCESAAEFLDFCSGSYRNMMTAADYIPMAEEEHTECRYFHVRFHYLTKKGRYCKAEGISRLKDTPFGKAYVLELFSSEMLAELRKTDGYTNLPGSHDFFIAAMKQADVLRREGRLSEFCPVYFDVSHFREYNRLHGLHRGNQCLKKIADTITQCFPGAVAGHLTADRFIAFLPADDLTSRLEYICGEVNRYIGDDGIRMRAGICRISGELMADAFHRAFDFAKVACDSIKQDGRQTVAVYEPAMGEVIDKKMYVLRNFSSALEKGYIKVYLQPVIRTITGSLCGFEALSRWDDPTLGMISPAVFVPVLEEAALIDRLDQFVLRRVLGILRDRMDNGLPLIPVSVNLSGCDFESSNPFRTIDKIVSQYKVPHSVIRFELTERVIIRNRSSMISTIRQFQKAGYQVWMDDFGSEYSSLNSLHNYHFDEIKIDMGFFSHFDDRSRQIITAIVIMAKMLGVQTLAEGVETKEQVDFLRKIGCARIQGFYYGRPMPYESCLAYVQEKNLKLESQEECRLLDASDSVNMTSDLPMALFRFHEGAATLMLENDAYRRELRSTGTSSIEEANLYLHSKDYPLRSRFLQLLSRAFRSRREESMVYVDNGQYMKASVRWIAGGEHDWIGEAALYNISTKAELQKVKSLDNQLRNLFHIYDGLYMLDRGRDEIQVLQCRHPELHADQIFKGIASSLASYAEKRVHPDDRQRFLTSLRPETLEQEAVNTSGGGISEVVRVRHEDGNYHWTVFEALLIYKSRAKNILICEREDLWEKKRDRDRLLPDFCRSFNVRACGSTCCGDTDEQPGRSLFQTLCSDSPYPFFWKSREGRIQGASSAFLKLTGIADESMLCGKTEADMGWIVDQSALTETERKVLQEGEKQPFTMESVLLSGRQHKVRVGWSPVYRNNEEIGALGMLESANFHNEEQERRLGLTDPQTGLLTYRGAIEAGLTYADQYRLKGTDYVGILMDVPAFAEVEREDPLGASAIMKEITHALRATFTPGWAIARVGLCCFLCFCLREKKTDIATKIEAISDSLPALWKQTGNYAAPALTSVSAFGSEADSLDDLFQLLMRRINSVERQVYGEKAYTGDRVIIRRDALESVPERVIISDPVTYELIYMNASARKSVGIDLNAPLRDMRCYRVFEENQAPCEGCPNVLLRQDRFCNIPHLCRRNGENLLIRTCLIQWENRVVRFTVAANTDEYINSMAEEHELIYQEMRANEAISVGMKEEDPDQGIGRILECISKNLRPDRFLIFEERQDNTVSATYEWTAPGILPLKKELQSISRSGLQALYKEF
ncbi:MAG: EAL domain-containing protein, partial [Lachnospira sp.]|nr:EAL domain-containing protein [Lachnospira sp.]